MNDKTALFTDLTSYSPEGNRKAAGATCDRTNICSCPICEIPGVSAPRWERHESSDAAAVSVVTFLAPYTRTRDVSAQALTTL